MSNPRDTQFAGFAELLREEIRETQRQQIDIMNDGLVHTFAEWDEAVTKTIAQRAYDLVRHTCEEVMMGEGYGRITGHNAVEHIPDMTELSGGVQ